LLEIIRVEIPTFVSQNNIAEFLLANQSEFYGAFNRRVKDHDVRSEVDKVRVTGIEIEIDRVIIAYEIDFCLRYGCQDLEHTDTHRRSITGKRDGRTLIFQPNEPAESRTTSDEF